MCLKIRPLDAALDVPRLSFVYILVEFESETNPNKESDDETSRIV